MTGDLPGLLLYIGPAGIAAAIAAVELVRRRRARRRRERLEPGGHDTPPADEAP